MWTMTHTHTQKKKQDCLSKIFVKIGLSFFFVYLRGELPEWWIKNYQER